LPSVQANGITLEYDIMGNPRDPTLLLIMGLGMQLIAWPETFCGMLVERGFRVIRFDNRDVGLSASFDHAGVPNMLVSYLKFLARLPVPAPYRIDDMAADTVGLLDALDIDRAHIVGASMGGMIAQNVAASWPGRVTSLTSMMSTTGRRSLPGPTMKARGALMSRPARPGQTDDAIERMVQVFKAIGSPAYPEDEAVLRERFARHVRRANRPAGVARQMLAIVASGDRTATVRKISAPTLVLHGAADPLVPLACGQETARIVSNARLTVIEGMGHDLPTQLLPRLAAAIGEHCARVKG
jgi:pimeloyl-ACP methyl ester carboxylesterase